MSSHKKNIPTSNDDNDKNDDHETTKQDFTRLERVSSKRAEWANKSLTLRLELLEEMHRILVDDVGYDVCYEQGGIGALSMMGIPPDTEEGELEAQTLTLLLGSLYKPTLASYLELYRLRVEDQQQKKRAMAMKTKAPPTNDALSQRLRRNPPRTTINGQICVDAFPLLKTSKYGLLGVAKGEVWLDESVTSVDQVEFFDYSDKDNDEFGSDGDEKQTTKAGGLMIVLGAGNQGGLALSDCLYGLFNRNCVVYLKLHALRYYTEPLIRRLFEPLIRHGYLELECHTTNERAAALVYHPLVTAVHLTGGKATHDGIVWGFDPKEQASNKAKGTPLLQAEMTSELGAVSPWIVVPANYSDAELKSQANFLAFVIHSNASCNCNAPKMVVISETWSQKETFLKYVETSLDAYLLPVPYYPGASQRWQGFRDKYPDAKTVGSMSDQGKSIQDRKLFKPLLSDKVTLLPHLVIDLSIDVTTEEGRNKAKQEYACTNEPFCPVYTISRLAKTESLDAFCETAATFCNDYVFGSLSGTVTVKPELQSTEAVQRLIAKLRYGSIGVNIWGGNCYACPEGAWGAFPGEDLANVESGIGRINNFLGLKHYQKFVLYGSIVSATYPKLDPNLKKQSRLLRAVNKFIITPGVGAVVELVSAVAGVDVGTVAAVGGAALAVVAGYLYVRNR